MNVPWISFFSGLDPEKSDGFCKGFSALWWPFMAAHDIILFQFEKGAY